MDMWPLESEAELAVPCFLTALFVWTTFHNYPDTLRKDVNETTLDDKSGYDHILFDFPSRTFFGIRWKGWFLFWEEYFCLCLSFHRPPSIAFVKFNRSALLFVYR